MVREGVECIGNIRARYDGEKRNPWDEAECGHHYARAMAAWSGVLALSGFRYHAPTAAVTAIPRLQRDRFVCFWSTATGWGTFSTGGGLEIKVLHGTLPCRTCQFTAAGTKGSAMLDGRQVTHEVKRDSSRAVFRFEPPITIAEGSVLKLATAV
jgi:non-lysosomal glucosylceramidase